MKIKFVVPQQEFFIDVPDPVVPVPAPTPVPTPTQTPNSIPTSIDIQKPFKKTSWIYNKLPLEGPLSPSSAAIVSELVLMSKDKASGGTSIYYPNLAFGDWSTPIYHVTTDIPKKTLVYSSSGNKSTLFRVPSNVLSALGQDKHCAIFDHIDKRFVDLWGFDPATLKALHGGLIENFPESDGTHQYPMGARACGFALPIGVITIKDLQNGVHEGVIAFSTPRTNTSPKWPANRVDSYAKDDTLVRMGQIFRLPASFVPDPSWPPILKIISVAFRDYGGIICDTTAGNNIGMAYIEDPRVYGKTEADFASFFGGKQGWQLGQMFPWSRLQAVA